MKTCLYKSTFIEEPLLTIFEFRGKIKKNENSGKVTLTNPWFYSRREETGKKRLATERDWSESGDVAKKSCLYYSFPLSFLAYPLASAEKNYIRILFVIKSLENIKRNFVTKQEICPSRFCARPEKNR